MDGTVHTGRYRHPVPHDLIEKIMAEKALRGNDFPKFGVFIIAYRDATTIEATLDRIPEGLLPAIAGIYIIDDFSDDETYEISKRLVQGKWRGKLEVFRNPRNYGYGGNQKIGYKYAIERNFDYVVMLHGDGEYAPEYLPVLMAPVLFEGKEVVLGSRMLDKAKALREGMPIHKFVGNVLLSALANVVLNLGLSEYYSGYRLYSCKVLKRIPFAENSDDFHFDMQLIVQCSLLGLEFHEVPIPTYHGQEFTSINGLKYAFHVCTETLGFRLHQLHLMRLNHYLVDTAYTYRLKKDRYSSHQQIARIPKPGAKVLDLGSSWGLVARLLAEKDIEVTGVDLLPPEEVGDRFHRYHQCDLNHLHELPLRREFDYIIISDVVEHLVNGKVLLESVAKYLRPDGRIIVSTGNVAIWFYRLSLLLGRFQYGPRGILDETHVKLYTIPTFQDLIRSCGYKILKKRYTPIPFELVFSSRGKSRLIRSITVLYYWCACVWPRMFAYQVIIEAELTALEFARGEGKIA